MAKFKIGDRVEITNFVPLTFDVQKNKEKYKYATIIGVKDKREQNLNIALKFDCKNKDFHTCDGRCDDEYGWWIDGRDIKIVETKQEESKKQDDEYKQEITNLTKEIKELTKKLKTKSTFETAMTEAILEKGKELAVDDIKETLLKNVDKYIQDRYGILPKTIEIKKSRKVKKLGGIFHKEFENIVKIVDKNLPLMLIGPAGSGKNHTLEQVAKALDLEFYFTNAITQEYKLTGFIDANGHYHETEFYKAFTNGGLFFLDEMDASCPESLLILNSAIANGYFDFPTGRKQVHKDFRVVSAANTYGTGADMVYVGRNVLDGATLDRFIVLNFDYDEKVEMSLSYDDDLYKFIVSLRETINKCSLRYIVSMRATINASKMLEMDIDKQTILKNVIIKSMSKDDINTIIKKIEYQGVWKDELEKYAKC